MPNECLSFQPTFSYITNLKESFGSDNRSPWILVIYILVSLVSNQQKWHLNNIQKQSLRSALQKQTLQRLFPKYKEKKLWWSPCSGVWHWGTVLKRGLYHWCFLVIFIKDFWIALFSKTHLVIWFSFMWYIYSLCNFSSLITDTCHDINTDLLCIFANCLPVLL